MPEYWNIAQLVSKRANWIDISAWKCNYRLDIPLRNGRMVADMDKIESIVLFRCDRSRWFVLIFNHLIRAVIVTKWLIAFHYLADLGYRRRLPQRDVCVDGVLTAWDEFFLRWGQPNEIILGAQLVRYPNEFFPWKISKSNVIHRVIWQFPNSTVCNGILRIVLPHLERNSCLTCQRHRTPLAMDLRSKSLMRRSLLCYYSWSKKIQKIAGLFFGIAE